MKHTQAQAQIHALDRVMYLLEEHSFSHLKMDNDTFAIFVETLYAQIANQVGQIKQNSKA